MSKKFKVTYYEVVHNWYEETIEAEDEDNIWAVMETHNADIAIDLPYSKECLKQVEEIETIVAEVEEAEDEF